MGEHGGRGAAPAEGAGGLGTRRKLAVVAAALVLGFLLAELGVRLAGWEVEARPVRRGQLFRPAADPSLRHENRPGARAVIDFGPDAPPGRRRVEIRVNRHGFRGPELEPTPPPGVLRIACVGDSHTFGHALPEGEPWPARLEELLRAEGRAVEVMNCGVNAYDTRQEVAWLFDRVLAFEPHVVVLQYHLNDTRDEEAEPADAVLALTHPRRQGWVRAARDASRFLDVVCEGVYRRRSLTVFTGARLERYVEGHPAWRDVQEALRRARDRLRADGIAFGVALFPFLAESAEGEGLVSRPAFERVKAYCAELGVPCLDAEPAFLGRDLRELWISDADVHANAEAHRVFAAAVHRWLVREVLDG